MQLRILKEENSQNLSLDSIGIARKPSREEDWQDRID